MEAATLDISGVNQYYGESHTLWDAGVAVPPGACVCLMGRNGVGKTTLLKVIMGLLSPRSGTMKLGDAALSPGRADLRAGMGIGYVPQGREIFPQLTVEENLRLGLTASGARDIPGRIFEMFPVLKKMLGRRGGDLSGGQQQHRRDSAQHRARDRRHHHSAEQGRPVGPAGRAEAAVRAPRG